MQDNIRVRKHLKNKKPIKKRKPSRPLDGINHRLLREAADNAPPTRAELETKAAELGLKFDGRTSDKKLEKMITESLGA